MPGKPELFFVFWYGSCVGIFQEFSARAGERSRRRRIISNGEVMLSGLSSLQAAGSLRVAIPVFADVVFCCLFDMKNRSGLCSAPNIGGKTTEVGNGTLPYYPLEIESITFPNRRQMTLLKVSSLECVQPRPRPRPNERSSK